MSILNAIEDFFGRRPAQPTNGAPPIQSGIIERSGTLYLVDAAYAEKGVKVVFLSPDLHERYLAAWVTWERIQDELRALPQSLRPRRKRSAVRRKVEEQA